MLGLTKKTEYALLALSHLARAKASGSQNGESQTSAREIADRYGVPLPLLMNILKRLQQKGFLRSIRGAKGGYCLARAATEISLDSIVEAMEGVVSLTQCTASDGGAAKGICERSPTCPMRWPVSNINDRFRDFLQKVTLAEVSEQAMGSVPLAEMAAEA